jgi:ABC-type multidrug transport system permease subunit
MNRFAKGVSSELTPTFSFLIHTDVDTIDNLIGDSLRMTAATASQIIGAIILISIVLPWFLLVVFIVLICYFYAALFYRASARELKVRRGGFIISMKLISSFQRLGMHTTSPSSSIGAANWELQMRSCAALCTLISQNLCPD